MIYSLLSKSERFKFRNKYEYLFDNRLSHLTVKKQKCDLSFKTLKLQYFKGLYKVELGLNIIKKYYVFGRGVLQLKD